jgi:hypothetical protein
MQRKAKKPSKWCSQTHPEKMEGNMSHRYLITLIAGILCCQVALAQQHYAVLINGNTPTGAAQGPKSYIGSRTSGIPDEFWNDTILM